MTDISSSSLQADYLIVGAGAMGMAFADTMLTETDASIIIVDKHHQPGGHWNNAYPYVRLHQPSAFYGVNSCHLGSDKIDTHGWNKGLFELATNSEVCAYFDKVMQQQFLTSGRVQYFPMCEYTGNSQFRSLVSSEVFTVSAQKVVDATYMNVTVPSMRAPSYAVDAGVACVPPNELPKISGQYNKFVVIGAGKTGMDACLFLLKHGVAADAIDWIVPRDAWLLDRARIQPIGSLELSLASGISAQLEAIVEAKSVEDLLHRVEKTGQLLRLDPSREPTMYRCATVTTAELTQLRGIENVIRLGRVKSITPTTIELDQGAIATSLQTLHIDCTADGLERRPIQTVFDNNSITLQSVRTCQQVFSAAFIAHVEASYTDNAHKNMLCTPVPHPDSHIDFLRTTLASNLNGAQWSADADLQAWLTNARLDGFTSADHVADMNDPAVQVSMQTLQATAQRATEQLQTLLAAIDK